MLETAVEIKSLAGSMVINFTRHYGKEILNGGNFLKVQEKNSLQLLSGAGLIVLEKLLQSVAFMSAIGLPFFFNIHHAYFLSLSLCDYLLSLCLSITMYYLVSASPHHLSLTRDMAIGSMELSHSCFLG